MGDQIYSYGSKAKILLQEGHRTTRTDQPLGSFYDHGSNNNRFRWAHIAESITPRGSLIGHNVGALTATAPRILSLLIFAKGCAVNGFGDAQGDDVVKIYSAHPFFNDTTQAYAGGTFTVVSGGGKGCSYEIARYEPGVTATTTRLWLQDPLREALTVSTVVHLRKNLYADLTVLSATKGSALPLGFATGSGAASGFQWIQTRGVGVGIVSGAVTAGERLRNGVASGYIIPANVASAGYHFTEVGVALAAAPADGFVSLNITIEK